LQRTISDYEKYIEDHPIAGALFLAVCRGKASEGLNFSDQFGRAVLVVGLPFPPRMDQKISLKIEQLDKLAATKKNANSLTGSMWYNQQASRAVNQAIGRVLRGKTDYGAIILADERYKDWINQLPKWLRPYIQIQNNSLTMTTSVTKFFNKAVPSFGRTGEKLKAATGGDNGEAVTFKMKLQESLTNVKQEEEEPLIPVMQRPPKPEDLTKTSTSKQESSRSANQIVSQKIFPGNGTVKTSLPLEQFPAGGILNYFSSSPKNSRQKTQFTTKKSKEVVLRPALSNSHETATIKRVINNPVPSAINKVKLPLPESASIDLTIEEEDNIYSNSAVNINTNKISRVKAEKNDDVPHPGSTNEQSKALVDVKPSLETMAYLQRVKSLLTHAEYKEFRKLLVDFGKTKSRSSFESFLEKLKKLLAAEHLIGLLQDFKPFIPLEFQPIFLKSVNPAKKRELDLYSGEITPIKKYRSSLVNLNHISSGNDSTNINDGTRPDTSQSNTVLIEVDDNCDATDANLRDTKISSAIVEESTSDIPENFVNNQSGKCLICLENFKEPCASISCGHVCCRNCWVEWLAKKLECPVCKAKVRLPQLTRIYI